MPSQGTDRTIEVKVAMDKYDHPHPSTIKVRQFPIHSCASDALLFDVRIKGSLGSQFTPATRHVLQESVQNVAKHGQPVRDSGWDCFFSLPRVKKGQFSVRP